MDRQTTLMLFPTPSGILPFATPLLGTPYASSPQHVPGFDGLSGSAPCSLHMDPILGLFRFETIIVDAFFLLRLDVFFPPPKISSGGKSFS